MNAPIANLDVKAGFSARTGSATLRVIGECTMNYDPRSLSLDLTCEPMESSAAVNHLHRCIEAVPTWTFRLERVESPNE